MCGRDWSSDVCSSDLVSLSLMSYPLPPPARTLYPTLSVPPISPSPSLPLSHYIYHPLSLPASLPTSATLPPFHLAFLTLPPTLPPSASPMFPYYISLPPTPSLCLPLPPSSLHQLPHSPFTQSPSPQPPSPQLLYSLQTLQTTKATNLSGLS